MARPGLLGTALGAGVAALAAAGLTWLFLARYWLHRDCIAATQSSCLVAYPDPTEANLTEGGLLWGVLALPLWLLAGALALRLARTRP